MCKANSMLPCCHYARTGYCAQGASCEYAHTETVRQLYREIGEALFEGTAPPTPNFYPSSAAARGGHSLQTIMSRPQQQHQRQQQQREVLPYRVPPRAGLTRHAHVDFYRASSVDRDDDVDDTTFFTSAFARSAGWNPSLMQRNGQRDQQQQRELHLHWHVHLPPSSHHHAPQGDAQQPTHRHRSTNERNNALDAFPQLPPPPPPPPLPQHRSSQQKPPHHHRNQHPQHHRQPQQQHNGNRRGLAWGAEQRLVRASMMTTSHPQRAQQANNNNNNPYHPRTTAAAAHYDAAAAARAGRSNQSYDDEEDDYEANLALQEAAGGDVPRPAHGWERFTRRLGNIRTAEEMSDSLTALVVSSMPERLLSSQREVPTECSLCLEDYFVAPSTESTATTATWREYYCVEDDDEDDEDSFVTLRQRLLDRHRTTQQQRNTSSGCSVDVCALPCGHIFHTRCVASWFEKNPSCPVCKGDVRTM